MVRGRIVRLQLDGASELRLRLRPLPETAMGQAEGGMCFGERRVNFERLPRRRFCLGRRFDGGRSAILGDDRVAIRDTGISQRIIRVAVDGLMEKVERGQEARFRPLVPVEPALLIELVRLTIVGVAL